MVVNFAALAPAPFSHCAQLQIQGRGWKPITVFSFIDFRAEREDETAQNRKPAAERQALFYRLEQFSAQIVRISGLAEHVERKERQVMAVRRIAP